MIKESLSIETLISAGRKAARQVAVSKSYRKAMDAKRKGYKSLARNIIQDASDKSQSYINMIEKYDKTGKNLRPLVKDYLSERRKQLSKPGVSKGLVNRIIERLDSGIKKKASLQEKIEREIEMNKQALLEDAYISAFNEELEKIGKIRVGDVEDEIGMYLPDNLEDITRELIAKETAKRFAVRHPWLTGIPTLGIWPTVSKDNAIQQIKTTLARRNPRARNIINEGINIRREKAVEDAKLQAESDKANQLSNAVSASILPIMAYASMKNQQ